MSLPSRNARLLVVLLAFASIPFSTPSVADEWQEVTIKTISTDGRAVTTSLEMSVANAGWKPAEGEQTGAGVTKLFVKECNGSVKFKAYERDNFGFYTRQNPYGVKFCSAPEIVFDDYVPTIVASVLTPAQLTDTNLWIAALGDDETAISIGPGFAKSLEFAFAKGEFGFVAIASSEVAASLRAGGLLDAAYPFETLSIQSTVSGVFQKMGVDPDQYPVFTTVPGKESLVMSDKAKEVLEKYQIEKLGINANARDFGKTGWGTMRSLAGADQVNPVEWKLLDHGIKSFDSSVFSGSNM